MGKPPIGPRRRSRWMAAAIGGTLIVFAVALTIAWQYLGVPAPLREVSTTRWVIYILGSLLSFLLIVGLVLIVILLLREVRLNERQSTFVSAVTHELKTPVASLRLYLDTLRLRDLPEERRLEFYRTMDQDLVRLDMTINDVLNAARYGERHSLDRSPLHLGRLVRRAIDLTVSRYQLPADAITFTSDDEVLVDGDSQSLETAMLNLLDNAVKYSGERVEVEVAMGADGRDKVHIRVKDHGIGMGRTHLPFVFNRFYRATAKSRRSQPGTGLGLFIVRSVVKAHGGSVAVESPGPDRGSTFTIVLPRLTRPVPEVPL